MHLLGYSGAAWVILCRAVLCCGAQDIHRTALNWRAAVCRGLGSGSAADTGHSHDCSQQSSSMDSEQLQARTWHAQLFSLSCVPTAGVDQTLARLRTFALCPAV